MLSHPFWSVIALIGGLGAVNVLGYYARAWSRSHRLPRAAFAWAAASLALLIVGLLGVTEVIVIPWHLTGLELALAIYTAVMVLLLTLVAILAAVGRRTRTDVNPPQWRRVRARVTELGVTGDGYRYLIAYDAGGRQHNDHVTRLAPLQRLDDYWLWVDTANPGRVAPDADAPPAPQGWLSHNIWWVTPGIVALLAGLGYVTTWLVYLLRH